MIRAQVISSVCLSFLISALNPGNDLRCVQATAGFVTNPTVLIPKTPLLLPGYLQPFVEPDFHTKVTRVTKTLTNESGVNWADTVRHHYSKDQAWSAGMSHLLIYNYASPSYLLMDGQDYTFDRSLGLSPDEIRWHPTDDNLMIYTKGNSLYRYRVTERTSELIHTFTEYSNSRYAISMLFEGNLSSDGRMIGLQSPKPNGTYDLYSFDMTTGTKGTVKNLANSPDSISASPSGQYLVLIWSDTNTEVYDKNMNFVRKLPVNISHIDMTFDSDGTTEIAVGTAKPSGGGKLIKVPLISGGSTVLTDRGWVDHTSTRNIDGGEWAIGTFMEQAPSSSGYRKFLDEIVAVKLDGSGEVRRLAHTRSLASLDLPSDYHSEPQASISPDGTKVIFASNWDSPNGLPINSFVIDLFSPGDFNHDSVVDAADYTVWRDGLGTKYVQADYDLWRTYYGTGQGNGGGSVHAAVPEPIALMQTGLAIILAGCCCRIRCLVER